MAYRSGHRAQSGPSRPLPPSLPPARFRVRWYSAADPLAVEPAFLFWRKWRLVDERGFPPWLWPAPSLRLLLRDPDPCPPLIRYGPGLASGTPARHHG
jgi:hypothetical protein